MNEALEDILQANTDTFQLFEGIYLLKAYYNLTSNKEHEDQRKEREFERFERFRDRDRDRFQKTSKNQTSRATFINFFKFFFPNIEIK